MRKTVLFSLLLNIPISPSNQSGGSGYGEANGESKSRSSGIVLQRAFANLTFTQPTFLTGARDGTDRIFVTERSGTVHVFPNSPGVTVAERKVFLDLSGRVESRVFGSGENGFLSIAFHPDFAQNRKFYVSFTDTIEGHIRTDKIGAMMSTISEMLVSESNPDSADPASERVVLELEQPWDNHNGGQIAFGQDGYLYISLGDGRAPNDTLRYAQDPTNWFATVLRIDVDQQDSSLQYRIPPDNPFVGNNDGWKEEIYAYGLRNPWRFSFDRLNGTLWLADVGEKRAEEINIIESGGNYGWSVMEGMQCFREEGCDTNGLSMPVFEYTREGKGTVVTITGGYVYRGENHPSLQGLYVYGDYGYKAIWGLEYSDGAVQSNILITTSPQRIASFGEDDAGEIYVVGYDGSNSSLYEFVEDIPSGSGRSEPTSPFEFRLHPAFPNPFNPGTSISFDIPSGEHVTVTVYDALGREITRLANRRYEPGRYSVFWEGKDAIGRMMSSGTYLYSIVAGPFRQTGKMILIR